MRLRRLATWGLTAAIGLAAASEARAGIYADDLAKCMVSATSLKDQTDLVRWIFSVAALHPDVASIAAVTDEQRSEMAKSVAALFERLLTDACRSQFANAVQYEGPQTLEGSFNVLGQVAMRALMGDPAVAKGFGELDRYIDRQAVEAASKSATAQP